MKKDIFNSISRRNFLKYSIVGAGGLAMGMFPGCDSLEVEPASQLSQSTITKRNGIQAVLNSAYFNVQYNENQTGTQRIFMEESTTDIFKNFRGYLFRQLNFLENFTSNPASFDNWVGGVMWDKPYRAIRDSNTVIANLENVENIDSDLLGQIEAEARFVRAQAYDYLHGWFGPVPLITETFESQDEEFNRARNNEEEIIDFIEGEFISASQNLPVNQEQYGRATKGAALGLLTKFYLRTKKWDKAVASTGDLIDLGIYSLWDNYESLFMPENEQNSEMVLAIPCVVDPDGGNRWPPDVMPPQFPKPSNLLNTATQVTTPVAFYETFENNDVRKNLFLTEYENTSGEFVDLLVGEEFRNPRSFKYPIDPDAVDKDTKTDIPVIRYADILLSRAEALAMANNSVPQESLSLLNQVRNRAGLSSYQPADAPNRDVFINLLLQERAWEFYSEAKRREDLIRHDKFIENAHSRGKTNAQEFHRLFPIPQSAVDANINLEQNPGY